MSTLTVQTTEVGEHLGDNVCVYYPAVDLDRYSAGSCGQGGVILRYDEDSVTIVNPPGQEFRFEYGDIHRIELEHADGRPILDDTCIDASDECFGPVTYWNPGYGYRSFTRCDYHGTERIMRHQKDDSFERYADSDVAPSWFDPDIAGERWDDDY